MAQAFRRAEKTLPLVTRVLASRLFRTLDDDKAAFDWDAATAATTVMHEAATARWAQAVQVNPAKAVEVKPSRAADTRGGLYARALTTAARAETPKVASGEYRLRVRAWLPSMEHKGCGHAAIEVYDPTGKSLGSLSMWPAKGIKGVALGALLLPSKARFHTLEDDVAAEGRSATSHDLLIDEASALRAVAAVSALKTQAECTTTLSYGLFCSVWGAIDRLAHVKPGAASAAGLGEDPFSGVSDPVTLSGRAIPADERILGSDNCATAVARVLTATGLSVNSGWAPYGLSPDGLLEATLETAKQEGIAVEDTSAADASTPGVAVILAKLHTPEARAAAATEASYEEASAGEGW